MSYLVASCGFLDLHYLESEMANLNVFSLVGVGAGLTPGKYLVPGTQMDVSIGDIGTLRNTVVFE